MLVVCTNCKKEMICDKNGLGIDYGNGHVYPSDRYLCKNCGATIAIANDRALHDPNYQAQTEYLVMKK
jgi:DNA-directed RNA polymerase subunit RPC12/RpoP